MGLVIFLKMGLCLLNSIGAVRWAINHAQER